MADNGQTSIIPVPDSQQDGASESFAKRLLAAVKVRDAEAIRRLAEMAGERKVSEAVRPLCAVLEPPSIKWQTPRKGELKWALARIATVRALQVIDDPRANGVLVRTLASDPEQVVRAAAAEAVNGLSDNVVPEIVGTVATHTNWELDGFCSLINRLGNVSDKSDAERRAAGKGLIEVLYENRPLASRRWTRHARILGTCIGLLTMFAVLAIYGQNWRTADHVIPLLLVVGINGLILRTLVKSGASLVLTAAASKRERRLLCRAGAESMVRLNDKRAIPAMLQLASDSPQRSTVTNARTILMALLPQLSEADARTYSSVDIANLNYELERRIQPKLTMALLHAIEAVGNESSLRFVKRVANRAPEQTIRTTALRVVEVLEARKARLVQSQTLLRGAASPSAPAEELLRAAMAQKTESPDQLLRAIQPK